MDSIYIFELLIAMMVAIVALHYLGRLLGLPPAVALIVGGAGLAFIPGIPEITLEPHLALVIFLPPLLMDGALAIPLRHVRTHLAGILSLAIGAVVFTTVVVAVVAHWLMPWLPWAACAALGAIVSPPDAISARAVLQRVKLPYRLSTLLEGESLLNDATGLVLFRFAVAAAATGAFSTGAALGTFALLALGGALVGAVLGIAWVMVARKLQDDYLTITATVLLAWGTYLLAERLGVSGVTATVVAGLICGWYQHEIWTASARIRGRAFWSVLIFLLEASVFILIGTSMSGVIERAGGFDVVVEQMAVPVAVIVLALTLARFAWVFGADALVMLRRALGSRRAEPLGPRSATVIAWAGMRGVVTLAVAMSVPENMPGREFMLITASAVILVTVLVQGTTLGAVIRWARPAIEKRGARLSLPQAEAAMAAAQLRVVEQRAYAPDGTLIHPQLLERYRIRARASRNYAGDESRYLPQVQSHYDVIREAVAAGRAELLRMHRAGEIDDATLRELERDLDLEELATRSGRAG